MKWKIGNLFKLGMFALLGIGMTNLFPTFENVQAESKNTIWNNNILEYQENQVPSNFLNLKQGKQPLVEESLRYVLSYDDNPVDTENLNFVNRDYERFDSYDTQIIPYPPPQKLVLTTEEKNYMTGFKKQLLGLNFKTGYEWFRWYRLSDYNIYTNAKQYDMNNENVMSNVSLTIFENYVNYTHTNIDNINWRQIPHVNDSISWMTLFINDVLKNQNLKHINISQPNSYPTSYDSFGLYGGMDGTVGTLFHQPWVTYNRAIFYMHYAHLLPSDLLKSMRISVMAGLTGMSNYLSAFFSPQTAGLSVAQWLNSLNSLSISTTFMIHSQNLLTQRKDWLHTDEILSADTNNGKWTVSSALDLTNLYMDFFVNYTTYYGMSEFGGAYTGWELTGLSNGMHYSPNKDIYDKYEKIWKLLWWDLAANYIPQMGLTTGPATRSYNLFTGGFQEADGYWIPQYIHPMMKPLCDTLNTCVNDAPTTLPHTGDIDVKYLPQFWAMWQLANIGYVPYDVIKNLTIDMPYRFVEQRYTNVIGQERYNFITPYFSIGHSGEHRWLLATSYWTCARLSGEAANNQGPDPLDDKVATKDTTPNMVRLMATFTDSPFSGSVPGNNLQAFARERTVQYRNVMLVTDLVSLLAQSEDYSLPVMSNLILPINSDNLYADKTPLSQKIKTITAIPINSIITVRHQNASIVIRLLIHEHESNIADSQTFQDISYKMNSGLQPYSLIWQVEPDGYSQRSGRIIAIHKHSGDKILNTYKIAWLWMAGITRTDEEMFSLQDVLRKAIVTNNINNLPSKIKTWNPANAGDFSNWNISVKLTGYNSNIELGINRNDSYYTDNWRFPNTTSWNPILTNSFKTINGQIINSFNDGDLAYKVTPYSYSDIFQPHLIPPSPSPAPAPSPKPIYTKPSLSLSSYNKNVIVGNSYNYTVNIKNNDNITSVFTLSSLYTYYTIKTFFEPYNSLLESQQTAKSMLTITIPKDFATTETIVINITVKCLVSDLTETIPLTLTIEKISCDKNPSINLLPDGQQQLAIGNTFNYTLTVTDTNDKTACKDWQLYNIFITPISEISCISYPNSLWLMAGNSSTAIISVSVPQNISISNIKGSIILNVVMSGNAFSYSSTQINISPITTIQLTV